MRYHRVRFPIFAISLYSQGPPVDCIFIGGFLSGFLDTAKYHIDGQFMTVYN